jgi:nucleotide-binding universal stress UspA family protein
MRTFLVPLDGSDLSQRVLPVAEALARATGGRLVLMEAAVGRQAFDDDGVFARKMELDSTEEYLGRLEEGERRKGLAAEHVVLEGPAVDAILAAAEAAAADAIVMATHAHGAVGRLIAGSVADAVSRAARLPVLLVPPRALGPFPADGRARVLVPLDGSVLAEQALGPAADLARALEADVLLLRVVEPPPNYVSKRGFAADARVQVGEEFAVARRYVHERARDLRTAGSAATGTVRIGDPADAIVRVAAEKGASIVAMATHGRGGLTRLLVGSVAAGVLARLSVPLLSIRPATGDDAPSAAEIAATAAVAEHAVAARRR